MAKIANGRKVFDPEDVELLAQGIKAEGLLQPIVVVKNVTTGQYEVLAGHLRLEACKKLGWKKVPAIVREVGAAPLTPAGQA